MKRARLVILAITVLLLSLIVTTPAAAVPIRRPVMTEYTSTSANSPCGSWTCC